jgi:nucleotide-binding universal stress UspA family protein
MTSTPIPSSLSLHKILMATDFSAAAGRASTYARGLALRFSASVEIVNVIDPSLTTSYGEPWVEMPRIDEKEQNTNSVMESVEEFFSFAGVTTRTTIREAPQIATELLRVAGEQGADLIVAGTESESGMNRFVLGSTAEELILNASCPVLTVGPKVKTWGHGPLEFRRIIFASDLTAESAKAAAFALSFAQDNGAHLYFCYVLGSAIPSVETRSLTDGAFQSKLKSFVPESRFDWTQPECIVEYGAAVPEILSLAERVKADLIVLGARKASFWITHLEGGITHDLLASATCPVLSVRAEMEGTL